MLDAPLLRFIVSDTHDIDRRVPDAGHGASWRRKR